MNFFSKNFFLNIPFFSKINLFKDYYLSKTNDVSPPKIISVRLVSPKDSFSVYSACDGFYGIKPGFVRENISNNFLSEDLVKLIDYSALINAEFFLWGDDIASSPFFFELLSALSERKLRCRLLTVCSSLEPYMKFFEDGTIEEVIFSFEVPPNQKIFLKRAEQYDFYQNSVHSINLLVNQKKIKCKISGSMIINSVNCYFIDEMLTWADIHAMDTFYFFHSSLVSLEQGKRHSGKFMDYFKIIPDSWKSKSFDGKHLDYSAIVFELSRVKKNKFITKSIFCPELYAWQIQEYYNNVNFSSSCRKCYAPWFMMNLLENGDIVSCANHPDYIYGNIKDYSFENLWNGELASDFRTQLILDEKFPICTRCNCFYI